MPSYLPKTGRLQWIIQAAVPFQLTHGDLNILNNIRTLLPKGRHRVLSVSDFIFVCPGMIKHNIIQHKDVSVALATLVKLGDIMSTVLIH